MGWPARPSSPVATSRTSRGQRDAWWAVADKPTVVERDAGRDVARTSPPPMSSSRASSRALAGRPAGRATGACSGSTRVAGHRSRRSTLSTGRETWHAVGSAEPYVRSLTATADDGALLANVHVGGIPRSGNGGASWKPTIDPDADVHQVRAHPDDPRLVLAPAAVGLAVSRDAGTSWEVVTDGLHATYLRAVAFTSGRALGQRVRRTVHVAGRALRLRHEQRRRARPRHPRACRSGWRATSTRTTSTHTGSRPRSPTPRPSTASDDAGRSWSQVASDLGSVHGVGVRE